MSKLATCGILESPIDTAFKVIQVLKQNTTRCSAMAHSKHYQSFKNKILHFDDDIEFADILYTAIKTTPIAENTEKLFDHLNGDKHPNLSRYSICQDNRLQIVRHLKSTISASYIKDIYEELTIYLRGITAEAYQNATVSPERIIGEHKVNMSAVDILSGLKDGTLAQTVIDNMFQTLENERSTIGLIKKVCTKLGVSVDSQVIDDAVYYLEIRHKLVHTDGFADEEFRNAHSTLRYTHGNYIDLTYQTIIAAKNAVFDLVNAIDTDALSKGIINPHT